MQTADKKIIILQEVDSTNNYANRLIQSKRAKDGTAVLAHYQKNGRGQTGNGWESEPNKNLLMSIILFPDFLQARKQFYLSKITCLALRDFLGEKTSGISIKWPNDIYVANKKIAGILIENSVTGEFLSSSVLGIGININQKRFNNEIPNAVSLYQINNVEYDVLELTESLISYIDYWFKTLKNYNLKEIDKQYFNSLYKKGKWAIFKKGEQLFEAKISGISEFGHLILEYKNGTTEKFMFKEVEYVI